MRTPAGSSDTGEAARPESRLPTDADVRELCRILADGVGERRIAVAESLTGGNLAAHLSRAPTSGEWFRGGIVAYHRDVKHELLAVPAGPVVSQIAARQMASRTAALLGADIVVAVTGEAGPEGQEESPGIVWFGVYDRGEVSAERREFEGDPEEILAATVNEALRILVAGVCGPDGWPQRSVYTHRADPR
ncbi:CinA family protein [Gordonia sp. PP30]|uniref:CinA family protein n=1 Tax=Gordonia sp. PP30 TaxID=2935861 RepID=UPI001FFF9317|nr:CinA family protein [Gordonia sp. PP30]UQE76606.1 CinA family protein [Gordonia sp. PP30]